MTIHDLENQLAAAQMRRDQSADAHERAASHLSAKDSSSLDNGVAVSELSQGQAQYLLALRAYNAALDRVQDLEVEWEIAVACEQFNLTKQDTFS